MTNNRSQTYDVPMESLSQSNKNDSNSDVVISTETVTTSQTMMEFTIADKIPSVSQPPLPLPKQFICYLPERPSMNMRQLEELRRVHRERHRQQHREQKRQEQFREKPMRQFSTGCIQQDAVNSSHGQNHTIRNYTSASYNEPFLHKYDLEYMEAKEQWEQEQVHEIETLLLQQRLEKKQQELEHLCKIQKVQITQQDEQKRTLEVEGYLLQQQLTLINDELEQLKQIDTAQEIRDEEQNQQQQQQELIHHELWENNAFLIQQWHHN